MGNRKAGKQRIYFVTLLLILSFTGAGCGDSRKAHDPAQAFQEERAETVAKAGALSYGYFFEKDRVLLSAGERILYSDWEPVDFDYICMDPACRHLSESCSALTLQEDAGTIKDFSLLYQDRLIILHEYSQSVLYEDSEEVWDISSVYQTDVYEADPDGSNRRKVAAFSGSIEFPALPRAAVLADGKLYFGGPTEVRERVELDLQSGGQKITTWVSAAVYCLDLNDYTIETFMLMEDKEGPSVYLYQIYEYDGMIYWMIRFSQDDSSVLYRSDPVEGTCEEILRFDSGAVMFEGVIGNTVYYWYENSGKTLYARDIAAGAEEREIMTVTGESKVMISFVLEEQLLIMTDFLLKGEDRMAEYTVFDSEGKALDTIRYDDYITFLDVVGDRILYFKLNADSEWEVWWADKEDLRDLSQKGVQIGPLNGAKLDTLKE